MFQGYLFIPHFLDIILCVKVLVVRLPIALKETQ